MASCKSLVICSHNGRIDQAYLLRCQVIVHPFLQSIANALRGDGLQVGVCKDLVDDCRIRSALLGRDCTEVVSYMWCLGAAHTGRS